MRIGHARCPICAALASVRGYSLVAAATLPDFGFQKAVASLQHHQLMVSSQENSFAAAFEAEKRIEYAGSVRTSIDVVSQKNDLIILPGFHCIQEGCQSFAASVNVPDSQSSHVVPATKLVTSRERLPCPSQLRR